MKLRARRMQKRYKKLKIQPIPKVIELKNRLTRQEPYMFNQFRDSYFMCDLYPENQERFSVTYEKAEAFTV